MIKEKVKLSVLFLALAVLFTSAFVVKSAVPAQAAGQKLYELKYQMAKGTKFTMKSAGEANSITDQMGTEMIADIYGDAEDIYVVLSADNGGGLTMELEFGKRSQNVDSTAGSDSTDFSELLGKKVKFILLPNGKVEGFEGFESLPEIMTSTGDEMTTETYILGMKTTFPLLPDKPVKFGDSWTDSQIMDIPQGSSVLRSENNYTYTLIEETEKDGFDCLKIEMKEVSRLSGDFEQGGMPLSIEREGTSSGTYYFAYKEGMFISSDSESLAEGLIIVPSAGLELPQTISSKGTVTVQFEK